MTESNAAAKGTDWTQLLADPELVAHLAELLKTYRDSPPAEREQALLEAMRTIKGGAASQQSSEASAVEAGAAETSTAAAADTTPEPLDVIPSATPPYEPSMFADLQGEDRRRHPRMKCFVVVELRLSDDEKPNWGTVANISIGGCFVETPASLEAGAKIEIGLWIASGQVWVKGLILNGVVARSNPSFGMRIKFSALESVERETLRQFLRFVETSTKGYAHDHGYLAQLKR